MSNITAATLPQGSVAYALAFGTVIVVALPLNVVSLWILLRRHSLKSPSAIFMVNLAVSDLLLAVSLPLRVYFFATGSWPFHNFMCVFFTMLFRNNIRSSSIFITFISVDRLLAVVYPIRSRHLRTAFNASKAAGLVWFFVVVINIPEGLAMMMNLNFYNESSCFVFHNPKVSQSPVNYLQPVLVLILLAVNIVSTLLVFWTLRRRLNDLTGINNKVNVMLIFAMNLLMFAVFFLPVSLAVFFRQPKIFQPLICLASVNCCLDPLLYFFSFDGFWRGKEDTDVSLARD